MRDSTPSVINPMASSDVMRRSFITAISSSHSASLRVRRGAMLLSCASIPYAGIRAAPVASACVSADQLAKPTSCAISICASASCK
jgi:hypothetical protein